MDHLSFKQNYLKTYIHCVGQMSSQRFEKKTWGSWAHINYTFDYKNSVPHFDYFRTNSPPTLQFNVVIGSILLWKEN